ncbi:hypothetical protein RIF29_28027 [Crotalaria pallida]|uniref:LOB domain-containing protein n=1 Tax=Crotalaria pallida TaxID=3830 RepID=A0AAN9ER74_CROPI
MNNNNVSRNNSQQACAACKYQRRKCAPDCIFAPYFPHDRQKQFLNAHRLFGVGKINSLIKPLDPVRRDVAMSTIIYESDMRANDPVGGCYAYIRRLRSQIEYYEAEFHLILQHLAFFKMHAQHHQQQEIIQQQIIQQQQHDFDTIEDDMIMNAMDPLALYNNNTDNVVGTSSFYNPQQEQVMTGEIGDSNGVGLQQDVITMSSLTLQGNNSSNGGDQYDQKPIFDLI